MPQVEVGFWGTRGSLPAPGHDTARYGGNTSCVTVEESGGQVLVLDGGTGIRLVGQRLAPRAGEVHVLLTHLHMDHIQGLGFFAPLFQAGRRVHIWGPPSTTRTLRRRLALYLSPPLFPVRIRELPSQLTCHDVGSDPWEVGGFRISARLVSHPDPTLGFRIEHSGRSVTYLPDHEPQLGSTCLPQPEWLSGLELAQGADLLIHDAQYTTAEYPERVGWGHCTPDLAVRFAEIAGTKRVALFHHDPTHSDEFLDRLGLEASRRAPARMDVQVAAEGDVYTL